jgi:hypothetical protein
MSATIPLILILLLASAAGAGELVGGSFFEPPPNDCEQVGATQTFDSGSTTGWTTYNEDAQGDCSVQGHAASGSIERDREATDGACSGQEGIARFDTDIGSTAGCAAVKLTGFDHGTAGSDGWAGPGLIIWHQSGDVSASYYSLFCYDGLPCTQFTFFTDLEVGQEIGNLGAFVVGDYLGACWQYNAATDTAHFAIWNMGATAPNNPTTWQTVYGSPDLSKTQELCDSFFPGCGSGERVGVHLQARSPNVLAFIRNDDVSVWRGCEQVGAGDSEVNTWETGNTWSTGNFWEGS